jgi:hypothetical protein
MGKSRAPVLAAKMTAHTSGWTFGNQELALGGPAAADMTTNRSLLATLK